MQFLVEYFKNPEWRRQQRWRRMLWNTASRVGLTGIHGLPMNRRWIELHRRRMPLRNLDPAFEGLKLVHISDLHYSPIVWERYLLQMIAWINDVKPDLLVVTGDLITGGYRYADRIARLLLHVNAPKGIICTLGNHDYSIYGMMRSTEGLRRADYLERKLEARGLCVLRNEVLRISSGNGGPPLVLVGLDDEWSGNIDPDRAFAGVKEEDPIICLNHNPANCVDLMKYPWQWMLAGHTHGRQVATTRVGRVLYPNRYRKYTHGYYAVEDRHLYVNRGLSYGQRVRQWCKPEITVFRLERAS